MRNNRTVYAKPENPSIYVQRIQTKNNIKRIPNNEEKQVFIEKRIKKLLSVYKEENLQPKITAREIKDNLDYETISKISDFRVINRIITSALTKTIDNAKDNIYKKKGKRKKSADK